ncbi:hypothetical protein [Yoonia sediminilitoris]|uniref:Response regulator receiver domain-containing protein n=1 Tax=Yoonia sediminilitoris TaxID=1286148 RepID=A0A2T6KEU5_9RHOB|nr:hypothetical protein [Yoonia sediminilitoris]PUB13617.1 hypothetical protein C8N45_10777 [Yoonia sediminilitoris]RCW94787.1 hypothetical protein DFP92_10777 [Yoonia sediminilitoris]
MKALILRDDPEASVACAKVLSDKGFQVICVETRHIARALLRIETVDVLIMDERLDGRLTHSIALSAERRLPFISTLIMTNRNRTESDELFDLIPSLYCLLGTDMAAELVARFALSAIENYAEAEARVRRNQARDLEEAAMSPGTDWELDDIDDEVDDDPLDALIADTPMPERAEAIVLVNPVVETPGKLPVETPLPVASRLPVASPDAAHSVAAQPATSQAVVAPEVAEQPVAARVDTTPVFGAHPATETRKRTFFPSSNLQKPTYAAPGRLARNMQDETAVSREEPEFGKPTTQTQMARTGDDRSDKTRTKDAASPLALGPSVAAAPADTDLTAISKTHTELLLDQIRNKKDTARMAAQQHRARIIAGSRSSSAL